MTDSQELGNRVLVVVTEAVRKLNDDLQYENLEKPGRETALWGTADGIDSLSLVNLAVDLERRLDAEFGGEISLTGEDALASETSPFRSVGALVDYIAENLTEGRAQ